MKIKFVLPIMALACSLVFANDKVTFNKAIISEEYSVTIPGEKAEYKFLPGELVEIREFLNDRALVVSVTRPWETSNGVWVPTKNMVLRDSFTKVDQWRGDKHIQVIAGDYSEDYIFNTDGTFKLKGSNDDGSPYVAKGKLYKVKNILWAKANKETEIYSEAIFIVMTNGKLCWPTPLENCTP